MRQVLFRTAPILINGTLVVAALQDVEGTEPFTLFVENLDIAATLNTSNPSAGNGPLFNSKNAQIFLTAVAPGTGGNAITLQFTKAANQAFSVGVVANAITVNLQCGPADPISGLISAAFEKNLAYKVVDAINASGPASALVTASLAPGSDGSAPMDAATSALSLAGGFASTTLATGTMEVSVGDLPAAQMNANGWIANAAAATAIGLPVANTVGAYEFTSGKAPGAGEFAMFRSLRVRITKGAANTTVVVTAISKRKVM